MRSKAIKDLCQVNDVELFKEMAEGLDLIVDHVLQIKADSIYLSQNKRYCGYNILEVIAAEEASKVLILLDSIRCPRTNPEMFVKQLKKFNDHLAKGIYAYLYGLKPATFKEVRKIIESHCQEYYLDGPNDFDWIFHNEILQSREEKIYVDYVENDEKHVWLTPNRYFLYKIGEENIHLIPDVIEVTEAWWKVGGTSPEALALIAQKWRTTSMSDDFHWAHLRKLNIETLELLKSHGYLKEVGGEFYTTIIERWLFPLYDLDIGLIKTDKSELQRVREVRSMDMF